MSDELSEEERSSAEGSASAATASAKRSPVVPAPVAWARLVAKSSPVPATPSTADEDDDADAEPTWGTPGDCCSSAMVCSMSAKETGLMVIAGHPLLVFRPVVRSSSSTASLRSSSARQRAK